MLFKNLIFFLSFCLVNSVSLFGQNQHLKDSLALQIRNAPSDIDRLKVYEKIFSHVKCFDYQSLDTSILKDAMALAQKTNRKEFYPFFEFMEAKMNLLSTAISGKEAKIIFKKTLENAKKNGVDKIIYAITLELGHIYNGHARNTELALDHLLKSKAIFESLDTTDDVQLPYGALSFWYIKNKKNFTKATYYAQKNLKLSLARGDRQEIGITYLYLARISREQGLYTQELEYYKQGLRYIHKKNNEYYYADTLFSMAENYSVLKDTIKALKIYRKSLKIFQKRRNPLMIGEINQFMGLMHLQKNKKDSAYFYFDKCVELYNEIGNDDLPINLKLSIGKIYLRKGQIEEALKYYFEALTIAEQSNNNKFIASISNNIASVHKSQDNITEAIDYQNKALQNYTILKDSSNIAGTKNNISELLLIKKEYQKSLISSQEALLQFVSFRDSCQIGDSYIIMGKSYYGLKKIDSAKYYLDKGIPLTSGCKNMISSSLAYTTLGEIYTKKNKDYSALQSFEMGFRYALQANDLVSIKNAAEFLYPHYKQKGQYKKAFETINLYQSAKDSLFNQENTRSLVQKELEYDFEKTQQEQAYIQQQKNAAQQRAIDRQQSIIYGVVLACLSFIGLTLLYYRNLQNKKKANALLNTQNKEIAKQKATLEELDASKSRLYANISHELRTPLTLISSPISYVLDDPTTTLSIEHREQLKIVECNTKQLKGLVNDILDLSKLESNRLELHEDAVLLKPFLKKVVSNFDSLAQHLGIQYEMTLSIVNTTTSIIDRDKVEKIINNLLSNAIKHTPSGGTVHLMAAIENDRLLITVADNGYGIPEEDIPNIFDRFYQGKNNKDSLQGGTGIGLALAKDLIQLMDGSIEVASQLGKGSSFALAIPYKETAVTDYITDPEDEEFDPNEVSIVRYKKISFEHAQNILIVEDHPDMQRFIVQLLGGRNYNTHTANNGKQALEILGKHPIDLIISDVMMPEMDGYELLQIIKDHDIYKTIPVVMLTALDDIEHRLQALTIGVDDYLSKPFSPEELTARVHNLLKRYEVRKMIAKEIEEEILVSPASELIDTGEEKGDTTWLEQVAQIIRKELENENFNLSTLADQFFLSSRQFQRKIKKITGLTPKKFQIEIALQEARKLLETNAYQTVKAVAMTVGMSNIWRFSQLYQERFGKKPSDYF